ncbi:hypothetical protein BC937DRAFT_92569 [Endogone sp. FLAS-F59071]|nr:hypothetical protein BC937DRAFT_92569 [Endogone sp. FLAS-F59071]|eukprot:RUS15333.1 hypothetical protein BC937DRAFT_92569 [Endogone sp. FLAS-F59071]
MEESSPPASFSSTTLDLTHLPDHAPIPASHDHLLVDLFTPAPAPPSEAPLADITHTIPPLPTADPTLPGRHRADWRAIESWIGEQGHRSGARFVKGRSVYPALDSKSTYAMKKEYQCHCAGRYESTAGKRPEKKSRLGQKPSKKLGCTSVILVRVVHDGTAQITFNPRHVGHVPGSWEDVKRLGLSERVRADLRAKIRGRMRKDRLRVLLSLRFGDAASVGEREALAMNQVDPGTAMNARDRMITSDDIYNVFYGVVREEATLADAEPESVARWAEILREERSLTMYERDDVAQGGERFIFAIQTSWQRAILERDGVEQRDSGTVFLVTTEGTNRHGYHLLSLVVHSDDVSGSSLPVAFALASHKDAATLSQWFDRLLQDNPRWRPCSVATDNDPVELETLASAMPWSDVHISRWHLARAWTRDARDLLAHRDREKEVLRELEELASYAGDWDINTGLALFDERRALRKVEAFTAKWHNDEPAFFARFSDTYLLCGKHKLWIAGFRAIGKTTNDNAVHLVDSFHRRIRYFHLERRTTRRVDLLIYLLVRLVVPHAEQSAFTPEAAEGDEGLIVRQVEMDAVVPPAEDEGAPSSAPPRAQATGAALPQPVYLVSRGAEVEQSVRKVGEKLLCSCFEYAVRQAPCAHVRAVATKFFPEGVGRGGGAAEGMAKGSRESIISREPAMDIDVDDDDDDDNIEIDGEGDNNAVTVGGNVVPGGVGASANANANANTDTDMLLEVDEIVRRFRVEVYRIGRERANQMWRQIEETVRMVQPRRAEVAVGNAQARGNDGV